MVGYVPVCHRMVHQFYLYVKKMVYHACVLIFIVSIEKYPEFYRHLKDYLFLNII